MKRLSSILLYTLLPGFGCAPAMAEGEHQLTGKASVIFSQSDAITQAGMSRLEGDDGFDVNAKLELSYEYTNNGFGVFGHGRITTEGQGRHGKVGLTELYAYYDWALDDSQNLTFTLGQLFLPSSVENREDFWDSPYSNNFSALNTWIAQEVRPIGYEVRYDTFNESTDTAWGVGVMSFIGNDSSTSQLTWRGWSIGRHKTAYGELLDLPLLEQLENGMFEPQRNDGSKPFGRDLDHRFGWAVHGYWSPSQDLTVKATWYDNNGNGQLHRGEYAWTAWFNVFGVQWHPASDWTLLFETMNGYGAMGSPPVAGVSTEYAAHYILLSRNIGQWDHSIRLEQFDGTDTTALPGESNDKGRALTLSTRWQAFGKPWSVIGEWLWVDVAGDRNPAIAR